MRALLSIHMDPICAESKETAEKKPPCVVDEPCSIPLLRGGHFLVSKEDAEWASGLRWAFGKTKGYVTCTSQPYAHRLIHRLVMERSGHSLGDLVVDHIHHNKLDNRRSQLRMVTTSVNLANTKVTRADGSAVGVSKHKRGWRASWTQNYKKCESWHATQEEAVAARLAAKSDMYSQWRKANVF